MDGFPAMAQLAHVLTDVPLVMLTLKTLPAVEVIFNANSLPHLQSQGGIYLWSKFCNLESVSSHHAHHFMAWGERQRGNLFGRIVPVIQIDV